MELFKGKKEPKCVTQHWEIGTFEITSKMYEDRPDLDNVSVNVSNGCEYIFKNSTRAYQFLVGMLAGDIGKDGDRQMTLDAVQSYISILVLTQELLTTDEHFTEEIFQLIQKNTQKILDMGKEAAESITDEDEEANQDFMEGVARYAKEREQELSQSKEK